MAGSISSLEQLRVFTAVADAGGFAAAARRLGRSQPVVSYLVANLEAQLGFAVFERGRRKPTLTERGQALLPHARRICLQTDVLQANAENLRRGQESSLTLAVDALVPAQRLAPLLRGVAQQFPAVPVSVHTERLGAVLDSVLEGRSMLGISVLRLAWPDKLEPREFGSLELLPVAAPTHPLATTDHEPNETEVRDHVQLALRDTGDRTHRRDDFSLLGVQLWLLDDLTLKLELLRQGVGWGHMPLHLVQDDLDAGTLVRLRLPTLPGGSVPFTLLHRADTPPGPVRRWLMDRLFEWA